MARPVCTILGGTNGSDISSIHSVLNPPGEFINADDIARTLNPARPETASMAAGRLVITRLDELVTARNSFVYETTLSSRQAIRLMRRAKAAGYIVHLIFVILKHPDLNVERVRLRVASGGHDIPEDAVRKRYDVSLTQLPEAIRIADRTEIYDNSAIAGPGLLLRIAETQVEINNLMAAEALHRRLALIYSEASGKPEEHRRQ